MNRSLILPRYNKCAKYLPWSDQWSTEIIT